MLSRSSFLPGVAQTVMRKTGGVVVAGLLLVGGIGALGPANAQSAPEPTLPQAFGSEVVSTDQAVAALNAKNTKVEATASPLNTIAAVPPAGAVVIVAPPTASVQTTSSVPAKAKKKAATKRTSSPTTTGLARLLPTDTEPPSSKPVVSTSTAAPTTRPPASSKAPAASAKKAPAQPDNNAKTASTTAPIREATAEFKVVPTASAPAAAKSEAVPAKSSDDALAASFAALRKCESGGRYTINTGNGYYGAYQFALSTWRALGYSGYPHEAAPEVQDEAARKLLKKAGWGQWPACSRKLGLR